MVKLAGDHFHRCSDRAARIGCRHSRGLVSDTGLVRSSLGLLLTHSGDETLTRSHAGAAAAQLALRNAISGSAPCPCAAGVATTAGDGDPPASIRTVKYAARCASTSA